jgi:CRP-like cAMP-binding protein
MAKELLGKELWTEQLQSNQSPYNRAGTPFISAPDVGVRKQNFMQALNTLRDEEPAFDQAITIRQLSRGTIVATAEDLAHKMYVLMSGKVNLVCTNNEGRRLVIATLEPGAVFGEGALDNKSDPNIFAEAAEEVAIWTIPASDARSITTQYPILGWGLLQTYGERLLQVENSLEDVAYKKLPSDWPPCYSNSATIATVSSKVSAIKRWRITWGHTEKRSALSCGTSSAKTWWNLATAALTFWMQRR